MNKKIPSKSIQTLACDTNKIEPNVVVKKTRTKSSNRGYIMYTIFSPTGHIIHITFQV